MRHVMALLRCLGPLALAAGLLVGFVPAAISTTGGERPWFGYGPSAADS